MDHSNEKDVGLAYEAKDARSDTEHSDKFMTNHTELKRALKARHVAMIRFVFILDWLWLLVLTSFDSIGGQYTALL